LFEIRPQQSSIAINMTVAARSLELAKKNYWWCDQDMMEPKFDAMYFAAVATSASSTAQKRWPP
jgi:hypothetical protein